MSELRTYSISGVGGTVVDFPTGVSGFTGPPKVLSFDPKPQSTGKKIENLQIQITFDQAIQFSGISTIYLREGSASGSIVDSFDINSSRRSIAKNILTLEPLILEFNTTYYLTIPSDIIRNPQGSYYQGTEDYFFTTDSFSAVGGDASFKISDSNSPTGYYQYHVFTSTGILTTTSPTLNVNFETLMVAGGGGGGGDPASPFVGAGSGGGGGGVLYFDAVNNELIIPTGSHTVTIGAGGAALSGDGSDTTLATPSATYTSFGGGGGGSGSTPAINDAAQGRSGGSGGGSGGIGTSFGYYAQGNSGGLNIGGGGGSGAVGSDGPGGNGGDGNLFVGFSSSILGPYVPTLATPDIGLGYYAGGGGSPADGLGGKGGGGFGGLSPTPTSLAGSGTTNTGGGGGGSLKANAGSGGSGVCIIRYSVPSNY